MDEKPPYQPRFVRADAGHRFQSRKIGVGEPVCEVAQRSISRCAKLFAQSRWQDRLADRQVAIRGIWYSGPQAGPRALFSLQYPSNVAELVGGKPQVPPDLAIG